MAFRDSFDVSLEGLGSIFGPFFKPPPAFKLEGDFVDRSESDSGQGFEGLARRVRRFQSLSSPSSTWNARRLLIAYLRAIDEEFDEETKTMKEGG